MCGIAGYWDLGQSLGSEKLREAIFGMTQSMHSRGPDSGGLWIDRSAGLALGHRRLAIRDLSPLGHQPMVSPDGRYVLSYNGEIYNVPDLIEDLEPLGITPHGTSDTEVLLLALMAKGIEWTLQNVLGMYAFALWDRVEKRLCLARDRFGVKPLYWTRDKNNRFLFASRLDAFHYAGAWNPDIDSSAAALYLRFGYIPAPYSIWQNAHKLPQAHFLLVNAAGQRLVQYWSPLKAATTGLETPFDIEETGEEEIVRNLDNLLTDSVQRRMVSDVSLGAFLSGGIDSSVITALMQKCSPTPVRTFSIGFEEEGYNEAPFAMAVARHLHTDHTELYLPASGAWEIIPELPEIYDEPFGDASAVPTTLLSRLARRHVTTALSGDGGDEFFAGYGRYAACLENAPNFPQTTLQGRLLAAVLTAIPAAGWDWLAGLLPAPYRPRNAGARLRNFADLKLRGSFPAFYQRFFMQYWWHPDTVLQKGFAAPKTVADSSPVCNAITDNLALMQFLDTSLYLADDILTKVDRASMSCSLEVRTPLLDHRIFEFAWRIPPQWRQRGNQGKYFLRKVLELYVPAKLIDRPKMGFGIPIGKWITGPLRNWAESLLSEQNLEQTGLFRTETVRAAWLRHLSGASNWEYHLWVILMFLAWLKRPAPSPVDKNALPVIWA